MLQPRQGIAKTQVVLNDIFQIVRYWHFKGTASGSVRTAGSRGVAAAMFTDRRRP